MSAPVPVNLNAVVISPCSAILKKAAYSLEPGETMCSFLKYCKLFQTISKRFGTVPVRFRLYLQFTEVNTVSSSFVWVMEQG